MAKPESPADGAAAPMIGTLNMSTGLSKLDCDIVDAARRKGFSPEAVAEALRAGIQPGHLISHVMPKASSPPAVLFDVAQRLYDGLVQWYGSPSDLPTQARELFEHYIPNVVSVLEAKATEERMRASLDAWRQTPVAGASAPLVTIKRRRIAV